MPVLRYVRLSLYTPLSHYINGKGDIMQIDLNSIDGPKLVEIMEKFNIKPSEVGISRRYKVYLKRGEKKPSLDLVKRVICLASERGMPVPAWVGCESLRTSLKMDFNVNQVEPVPLIQNSHIVEPQIEPVPRSSTLTDSVIMKYLNEFRNYLFSRFTKDDARMRFSMFRKYGAQVIVKPMIFAQLRHHEQKHLLNALAAFRDFCSLLGINFAFDIKQLRKLMKKPKMNNILEYEEDKGIIEKALEMIRNLGCGKWLAVAVVSFFTGLRSTEIAYLINNYDSLKKIVHNGIIIVELGYERKSKKAWITMLPKQIEEYVRIAGHVDRNTINNMKDKRGFNISIMRKSHLAILSDVMMTHEIDLLQGRVSKITVKHYTKHLREIAEKYRKAFESYISMLHPTRLLVSCRER